MEQTETLGKEFYESADKVITIKRQETLEEIAERYYEDEVSINAFINGYKLAQEQFKNK